MKKIILICFTALLAYVYVFSGISWSVPSSAKAAMVTGGLRVDNELLDGMANAREYVYKDTKNHIKASPYMRSDEFRARARIEVDYRKEGPSFRFYNYLRHYFLCAGDSDESGVFNALGNIKPQKLQFNPHFTSYGGGYIYPLGASLKLLSLAGAVELVPDMRYYFRNPDEMGRLYTAARAAGAAVGTLGILLLALFVYRRSASLFWACAAAALCFSSPMAIVISKVMKPHYGVLALSVLALVLAHRYAAAGAIRYFNLAMAACGAAAGCVISTGIIALLPLLVYAGMWTRDRGARRTAAELLGGLGLMAAVMLALNPYWLLAPAETLAEMKYLKTVNHSAFDPKVIYYVLRYGLGTLPAAAFLAAVYFGLKSFKTIGTLDRALLVFLFAMLAVVCGIPAEAGSARWTVFIIPLFSYFTVEMWRLAGAGRLVFPALMLLCLLGAGGNALRYRSYYTCDTSAATSTRLRAGLWLNENLGRGAVGHLSDLIPWTFPPVNMAEHRLVVYEDIQRLLDDREKPEYFTCTGWQFRINTPEQRRLFWTFYKLEKSFANPVEVMPESWEVTPANHTIFVYKLI